MLNLIGGLLVLILFTLYIMYIVYDVNMEIKRPMVTRKNLFSIIRKWLKK